MDYTLAELSSSDSAVINLSDNSSGNSSGNSSTAACNKQSAVELKQSLISWLKRAVTLEEALADCAPEEEGCSHLTSECSAVVDATVSHILFSLVPADRISTPCNALKLCFGRRLKDGDLGAFRKFSFPDLFPKSGGRQRYSGTSHGKNVQSGVAPEERTYLYLMARTQGERIETLSDTVTIHSSEAEDILHSIVSQGRCYYDFAKPPLSLGPVRRLRYEWNSPDDGSLSPRLYLKGEQSGDRVLHLPSGFWYLDTANSLLGKLEADLDYRILSFFASAPRIAARERNTVLERLGDKLQVFKLPSFERIVNVDVVGSDPKPVLYLESRLHPPDGACGSTSSGQQPFLVGIARLAFAYAIPDGGVLIVDEGERDKVNYWQYPFTPVDRRIGDKVYRLRRHASAEMALGDVLPKRFGLQKYQEVDWRKRDITYWFARHGPARCPIEDSECWHDFWKNKRPLLEAEGWDVRIDDSFAYGNFEPLEWMCYLEHPQGGWRWFEFGLTVKVDGQEISLIESLSRWLRERSQDLNMEELRDAPQDNSPSSYILLPVKGGRVIRFPKRRLYLLVQTVLELFDEDSITEDGTILIPCHRLPSFYLLEKELNAKWEAYNQDRCSWYTSESLVELRTKLQRHSCPAEVRPPACFQASLRPYQQQGLNWLDSLRDIGAGGVLADDMGLGKTVQTLALLAREKEEGRMNLPCLIVCPESVVGNWKNEVTRFAPNLRVGVALGPKRRAVYDNMAAYDIVITNYVLLNRDIEALALQQFHYLVFDEAQALKNSRTQMHRGACRLQGVHKLCLSGTPIENHLGELWAIFNVVMPGLLGTKEAFNNAFRKPIEEDGDADRRDILVSIISPFLLRRRKSEVERDLPKKIEIVRYVELEGKQRDFYESIRATRSKKVCREVLRRGLAKSYLILLDALLKLRQVCNHPKLLKLASARGVEESAKVNHLREVLPQLVEEGRSILIFSQFVRMLDLLEIELEALHLPYVKLTGQTRDRESVIRKFQAREVPIFLISLKAGGSGINLTTADTVIHFDPWWNPAVDSQATDRAHRIGQTKPVFVYKLIARGSVEETMLAMQQRKRGIFDCVLEDTDHFQGKITEEDLKVFFKPLDDTLNDSADDSAHDVE